MPFEDMPSECDVIVLGTGLTESIVAAACSRAGKSVIHLDSNEYYGNQWASFSFEQLLKWVQRHKETSDVPPSTTSEVDRPGYVPWSASFPVITNVEDVSYVREEDESTEAIEKNDSDWTLNKLKAQSRRFNIDLCPRAIYSRGAMVELLVSSNICRYLEFKCVTRILSYDLRESSLSEVPCSRADIFNSKSISIIQKRVLMKFMNFCIELEKNKSDLQEFEGIAFHELLQSKSVDESLQHFLTQNIAMCDQSASTVEALTCLRKFTASVGRFGNTPFLWPLYGSGELPQAFCRLCAVFGGTYCLSQAIAGIVRDDERRVTHAIINEKEVACKHIVAGLANAPKDICASNSRVSTARAIFLTDRPLKASDKDEVTLLRMPAHDDIGEAVTVLEVGHSSFVVPKGLFVVYSSCRATAASARLDLEPAARKLFALHSEEPACVPETPEKADKPRLLWACYFNQNGSDGSLESGVDGLHLTNSPLREVDYEIVIDEARAIFTKMFPEEEFLPRAPDAEEIVIETQDNEAEPSSV